MEDNTTPNPSQEDVKTNDSENNNNETFEVSKEEFLKLKELESNKSTALKQERDEKKALAEKLAIYEAKEKEAEEKEKLKKWKYEELLETKTKEIQELSVKASAYDKLISEIQEKETNQLNDLINKVPKETLEKHSFILDDLSSNDKKIKFLETLIPKNEEKKDFMNKAKWTNPWEASEFDLLQSKVKSWKASPAERWKYLTLLRSK